MQYKLIGNNDTNNIIKTVLNNRSINEYNKYLNLYDNCYDNYSNLDNIDNAVGCFVKHFGRGDDVGILCDTDT